MLAMLTFEGRGRNQCADPGWGCAKPGCGYLEYAGCLPWVDSVGMEFGSCRLFVGGSSLVVSGTDYGSVGVIDFSGKSVCTAMIFISILDIQIKPLREIRIASGVFIFQNKNSTHHVHRGSSFKLQASKLKGQGSIKKFATLDHKGARGWRFRSAYRNHVFVEAYR